jgi:hypothetical protein
VFVAARLEVLFLEFRPRFSVCGGDEEQQQQQQERDK